MNVTALEVRLIAYGLLVLLLIGGSGYCGYRLTAIHYRAVMSADKLAQQAALAESQRQVIVLQQANVAAADAAEKQHAQLQAQYSTLAQRLTDSVRQYATLRSLIVSKAASATPEPHAAGKGPDGTAGIAELSGRAASACLEDAAELTALQSWARGISQ